MDPKKDRIVKLAGKWEQRTITPEEELELNAWYQQHQDEQINLPADFVVSEAKHEQRIWEAIEHQIGRRGRTKLLYDRKWLRGVSAAAAIFIMLAFGLFFYSYYRPDASRELSAGRYANDLAPGKMGATLTLASGKKIRLSDVANGEIAKEAGISVIKTADGQVVYSVSSFQKGTKQSYNTLSTAKGETYQVRLPDGSLVYLNSASSLTYAATLMERGKRLVRLSGEGYFEIAKDKKHPFVVKTGNQEVEVLGTHFNIMAYSNESAIATTLLEGSVKISLANSSLQEKKQTQILKPGEQALNTGDALKVSEANLENITDWKDGDFYFERVDFRTVMRKIARWYDVEVIYDASVPDDIKSGGWISRNNKLSAVLQSIEKSGQVHFKIEGKRIYVTK